MVSDSEEKKLRLSPLVSGSHSQKRIQLSGQQWGGQRGRSCICWMLGFVVCSRPEALSGVLWFQC
jgi:hypothetical protein